MIVLCTNFGLAEIALNGGRAAKRFARARGHPVTIYRSD
jgi:hypothetical protein